MQARPSIEISGTGKASSTALLLNLFSVEPQGISRELKLQAQALRTLFNESGDSKFENKKSNKTLQLIHVKQMHRAPANITPTPKFLEEVLYSQIQVAKIIKANPHCAVINESVFEDLVYQKELHNEEMLGIFFAAETIFPKGIPQHSNDLSQEQGKFLYDFGATMTLFFLGSIPKLYKSQSKDIHKEMRLQSAAGKSIDDLVTSKREEETMRLVKETAEKTGAPVLLVYGVDHDFKPYCDKAGYTHQAIECYSPALIEHLKKRVPDNGGVGAAKRM